MTKSSSAPQNSGLPAEVTDFKPVAVRTHEGWTPARQRAFIQVLAETASVRQAAIAVNMSKVSCYSLRTRPDADEFRRAWEAALDFGVAFLKDVAFERAVEGELEPVWVRGELKGYKRKYSNGLLMFLLRQYGQDNEGKRVTVSYFRTKAAVAAREGGGSEAAAEATTMTVSANKPKPGDSAKPERAAAMIEQFSGVTLDFEAEAEIAATLAACAARKREYGGGVHDLSESFVTQGKYDPLWQGSLEPPRGWVEDVEPFDPEEPSWEAIGENSNGGADQASVLLPEGKDPA